MSVKLYAKSLMLKMMGVPSCEEVDRLTYEFLEGQTDAPTTKQINRHLKACKTCQTFMKSYEKTRMLGKAPTEIAIDSEFRERIFSYLSQSH